MTLTADYADQSGFAAAPWTRSWALLRAGRRRGIGRGRDPVRAAVYDPDHLAAVPPLFGRLLAGGLWGLVLAPPPSPRAWPRPRSGRPGAPGGGFGGFGGGASRGAGAGRRSSGGHSGGCACACVLRVRVRLRGRRPGGCSAKEFRGGAAINTKAVLAALGDGTEREETTDGQ